MSARRTVRRCATVVSVVGLLAGLATGPAYADEAPPAPSAVVVAADALARMQCSPGNGTELQPRPAFRADHVGVWPGYWVETAGATATLLPRCRPGVRAVVQIVDFGLPPLWPVQSTGRVTQSCGDCWETSARAEQSVDYLGLTVPGARPATIITVRTEGWLLVSGEWLPFDCREDDYAGRAETGNVFTAQAMRECVAGTPVTGAPVDPIMVSGDA